MSDWNMQLLEQELAAHPFLKGMKPEHLKVLAGVSMRSEFTRDERIFREGESANRFYLIEQGKVALESGDEDGGVTTIQTIGAGDVLGWSWLFPPYYWHFDARALEPTKAIFLYGTRLREQCEADPALGYELMKRMAAIIITRLQATRKQLLAAKKS
ncbi:MAG: Crp/Fnr family transcriptional regulator [Verrucomicrobiota bacterium]